MTELFAILSEYLIVTTPKLFIFVISALKGIAFLALG